MLEDVLGWVVVLAGGIIMRFTNFTLIDPLMSIAVSIFILINATRNLKEIFDLFLEKAPHDIGTAEIRKHIEEIDGVLDVHHIHIWSMDGQNNFATLHVVTDSGCSEIKDLIREELREHNIGHVTIETETSAEHCHERHCHVEIHSHSGHCHHHGHHH